MIHLTSNSSSALAYQISNTHFVIIQFQDLKSCSPQIYSVQMQYTRKI